MTAEEQLEMFLARFDPKIVAHAQGAREKLQKRLPGAVELVYDNYQALVVGYGPDDNSSHAPFSIAIYPGWINLFFLIGARLADPTGCLKGAGSTVRHIRLSDLALLDTPVIEGHIASSLAIRPIPPTQPRRLVIKAIAPNQRPRRPTGARK